MPPVPTADPQKAFADLLRPLAERIAALRLDDAAAAKAALDAAAPPHGPLLTEVRAAADVGLQQGWLVPKEAPDGVRFGRVAKDLAGLSVDAVLSAASGPRHRHPRGEVDLLLARNGEPRFDGHREGWAVFPPGSTHVPAVTGGEMLILYFLPGGSIEWL